MYLYNTTIQSAELATGSAVAVTLPEDLPEDKQEVWEKFKQELASLKEDWMEFLKWIAETRLE